MEIIAHHGRKMGAELLLPAAQAELAVVFCHGFNGSRRDFLPEAQLCVQCGCAALLFDFCGGSVHDESGFPTTSMTLATETEDLHAAVDEVLRVSGARRAVLFGGSQGGLVCALAAAERRDVCGMMLLYPAFCIPDDWRRRFPDADYPARETLWGMTLGRAYFADACARDLAPLSAFAGQVLLVHGTEDAVVPVGYSRRAAARYSHARLVELAGEGHGFSPAGEARVRDLLAAFLRQLRQKF